MEREAILERIEELEKQIKDIRSGKISGDIHAIKVYINKYKKKIEEMDRYEKIKK
jgi:hypothetical protein